MSQVATGYEPNRSYPWFDSGESKYKLWKLNSRVICNLKGCMNLLPMQGHPVENYNEKNDKTVRLDNESLFLTIQDVTENGRKVLKILKKHYVSKRKFKIISLYIKFISFRTIKRGKRRKCCHFLKNVKRNSQWKPIHYHDLKWICQNSKLLSLLSHKK